MKSKTLILALILFHNYFVFSQNGKTILINYDESIYVKKDASTSNIYNIYTNIKSSDIRFLSDSYRFQIIGNGFEELPLEKTKEKAKPEIIASGLYLRNLKTINACELHEMFSLCKNIYLLKKENEDYYIWRLHYTGTSKNTVITNTN